MNTTSLLLISISVIGIIVSLFFGIRFLIRYKTTRKKLHLILGIVLTFIIPAILLYFAFRIYTINSTMVYGPGPIMTYGPSPV
jgi:hypothetical protein